MTNFGQTFVGPGGRTPVGPGVEAAAGGQERIHQLPRLARADARQKRQQPRAGDHVARVFGQPQKRHQVFDVGGLDELQPAVLVEGDFRPGQLGFQEDAVMRSAEQHGLTPQIDARLAVFENLADDVFRLVGVVLAVDQAGPFAVGPLGPEVLGVSFAGQPDHAVGGVENRLRAAVVLFERDDRGVLVMLGEIEDVAHGGGAKGVDRLGVVADDGEPLALGREAVEDFGLQRVGVLVLVDQDAIEELADGVARGGASSAAGSGCQTGSAPASSACQKRSRSS